MSIFDFIARSRRIPRQSQLASDAREHYRRGNRFFDSRLWDKAGEEWRKATGMWRHADAGSTRKGVQFLNLRAVLVLLLTVLAIYIAIFSLFPRDPSEMIMLTGNGFDNRSWWEQFLNTGREQQGSGRKMGVREWWQSFKRRMQGGQVQQLARRRGGRPSIDKRWEELLRRHGRRGPFYTFELDYNVISGYGLSRMGDYEEALRAFEKGIEATQWDERAKLADLYQGLANAHYYRGYHLQENGLARYELDFVRKSSHAYEKSVGYQPRPVSYGNLGWMYFLLGDFDLAGDFSRKALGLNSNLEYVRLNLGLIYLAQEKIYDAFEVYTSVIRRNPASEVYLGGINDLREITRDNPGKYPFAQLMIGLLELKKGDFGNGRRALERFLTSPFIGQSWRSMASRVLQDMDTRGL
jgi:tetratricopeptide (TPR) repeat protein